MHKLAYVAGFVQALRDTGFLKQGQQPPAAPISPPVAPATLPIQLKSTPVRSGPGPFSAPTGVATYGTKLPVMGQQGAWTQVGPTNGMAGGWVHNSAIQPRPPIKLRAGGDTSTGADSSSVAIAGKG